MHTYLGPIVPVVGMLCGNAITGISVSLGYVLKELACVISSLFPCLHRPCINCSENYDDTETLPGASRLEACRTLQAEALRFALMPTINQMRCVSARSTHTFPLILRPSTFPCQCNGHRRNSRHDGARDTRWRRHRAGRAAADDHRVHDLRVECALVYHCHALGSDGMRRFRMPHPLGSYRYASSLALQRM
jgi:hypothetical protein